MNDAASHLERPKPSATTLSSGKQATMHRVRRLALIPLTRRGAPLSQNLSHHGVASTSSALQSLPLRVPLRRSFAFAFAIGAFRFSPYDEFWTFDGHCFLCIFD